MNQTLRKGMKGLEVKKLQLLLNGLLKPSPKLFIDGDFGNKTLVAVKLYQKEAELVVDGVVGSATWKALAHSSAEPKDNRNIATPYVQLVDIAKQYIGVKETGNNKIGKSEKMREIFEADDLAINGETDGYPWCAAFVSLCVQKLCKKSSYFSALVPPREPSVNRFLTQWAKQQGCLIFSPHSKTYAPRAGDIVVFTFSHIGIVESNNGKLVSTIEGNTNAAGSREGVCVARKSRSLSIVRKFIRLPMTTSALLSDMERFLRTC
ncbi:CHAP domain-containing protein [Gallaecimonas kandeliae]|uniref:peptidoglycan-binding protein n=1 Tax=Gallaecimonas kandeliae TaxID=3029055 RepID=UPI0026479E20|nr:peptidoglycan-binding protein [Gallaecimonas kandeliae]WKE64619.1 CHAP domain-containing protein [Gallaecimonas kandeliae]